MEAFWGEYDPSLFANEPVAYAVEILDTDEARLEPSSVVRMVHVPGVIQRIGPSPEPGAEPIEEMIDTDMFAFFDANSGSHLATVYIGPPTAD